MDGYLALLPNEVNGGTKSRHQRAGLIPEQDVTNPIRGAYFFLNKWLNLLRCKADLSIPYLSTLICVFDTVSTI